MIHTFQPEEHIRYSAKLRDRVLKMLLGRHVAIEVGRAKDERVADHAPALGYCAGPSLREIFKINYEIIS